MKAACAYIGMELEWEGSGDTEIAKEKKTGIVSFHISLLYATAYVAFCKESSNFVISVYWGRHFQHYS